MIICGWYYHVWLSLTCVTSLSCLTGIIRCNLYYYHVWLVWSFVAGIIRCDMHIVCDFIIMSHRYYQVWHVLLSCVTRILICGWYYHVWLGLTCVTTSSCLTGVIRCDMYYYHVWLVWSFVAGIIRCDLVYRVWLHYHVSQVLSGVTHVKPSHTW
jgi:hypothetical protein